jgi:hypothetical protein
MTDEEAYALADAYISQRYPGAVVTGLLQDEQNYLIEWSSPAEVPLGDGVFLISKVEEFVTTVDSCLGASLPDGMTSVPRA